MSSQKSVNMRAASADQQSELSEAESDTSSIDVYMKPPSPAAREQLVKRMESVLQENRVLKVELDALHIKVKTLQVENKQLKETSFQIQAKAEQEEEFISNTLLKKIQELKREKEALALNYEQEEECLTNDLSRKLSKLKKEKAELTHSLQEEQESLVARLVRRIKKLEAETNTKQQNLEQLRREKVELENTLEQEQEALVNKLWKRMDHLESEKQYLQRKLDQPATAPPSPMDFIVSTCTSDSSSLGSAVSVDSRTTSTGSASQTTEAAAGNPLILAKDIIRLRGEVMQLKQRLRISQTENSEKMAHITREEQHIREENCRLQRQLQIEIERREQLCHYLSESESSLDVDVDDPSTAPRSSPMAVSPGLAAPGGTFRPVSPAVGKGPNNGRGVTPPINPPAFKAKSMGMCRCPSCGYPITLDCLILDKSNVPVRGSKFARPPNPTATSGLNSSPRIRSESLPGAGATGSNINDEISPKKE